MERSFGPLMQNAFVVPDLAAAVDRWTGTLSVGPFFQFPKLEFTAGELHGQPHIPRFQAAVAYSGDLMIELIMPEGPSIFSEFLEVGGTGVHHNCVLADDLDVAEAALTARGGRRIQAQTVADGSRIAYLQMPGDPALILEIAQLTPDALGLFAAIRAAAADWDGVTPWLKL